MPGLIDPSKFTVATAECWSGGKPLHAIKDCPQDKTCPVWVSFNLPVEVAHRKMRRNFADYCTCGEGPFRDTLAFVLHVGNKSGKQVAK